MGHRKRTGYESWNEARTSSPAEIAVKSQTSRAAQAAGRDLAAGGARVARVHLGVDEPVQGHGRAARPHHGDGDPEQVCPAGQALGGQEGAGIGERQRVHAVLHLDETSEEREPRIRGAARCGHEVWLRPTGR